MHNNSGTSTVRFFQIHTVIAGLYFSSRTEFLSLSGSKQLPSAIRLTPSFRIKISHSDLRHKFRDFLKFFICFLTWPIVSKKCFFLKKHSMFSTSSTDEKWQRNRNASGNQKSDSRHTSWTHCQFATKVWNCKKALYWGESLLKWYLVKFCLPPCNLSIKILCASTQIFFLFSLTFKVPLKYKDEANLLLWK